METFTLLRQLQSIGVVIAVDGADIVLRPASRIPAYLVGELRQHKPAIIEHLQDCMRCRALNGLCANHGGDHASKPQEDAKHYRQMYDGPQSEAELADLELRVLVNGVCLTWCEELRDYVAFCADEYDQSNIPPGFVAYTEREIVLLDGLDTNGFRRVHAAKRTGAVVTDVNMPDSAT